MIHCFWVNINKSKELYIHIDRYNKKKKTKKQLTTTKISFGFVLIKKKRKKMRPPAYNAEEVQEIPQEQGERNVAMAVCVQLAGRAIIRVVSRCEEAQDNCNLDLSECQLMQVPDAVYHLMRHTELKRCDLSGNVITKIPPKFAVKFSLITELNLSHNQMSKLPEELAELQALERLNISHNTFIALPPVTCRIPHLKRLLANNNSIIDIDVERIKHAPALEYIDLQANPLTPRMHDLLGTLTRIRVELTPRQVEDWEDLTV